MTMLIASIAAAALLLLGAWQSRDVFAALLRSADRRRAPAPVTVSSAFGSVRIDATDLAGLDPDRIEQVLTGRKPALSVPRPPIERESLAAL